MFRLQSLCAAAIPLAPTRLLFTSSSSRADAASPSSWPLLKSRSPPGRDARFSDGAGPSAEPLIDGRDARPAMTTTTTKSAEKFPGDHHTRDPGLMVIINGLSPTLNASDFYRLAPSDLSSWQSVINKIQQQRDAVTLEPMGKYYISFSTPLAAISYRDRLIRLHKLACHRLDNVYGLWESRVPVHLLSPAGDDPASELDKFTLTSGLAGRDVDVQRRRVTNATRAWVARLTQMTERSGYGGKPPVVLLRIYPPTVTAAELGRWIHEDGVERGCEWEVCPPQELHRVSSTSQLGRPGADASLDKPVAPAHNTMDARKASQGRFVVVCANDVEARRFHRRWNQRTIPAGPENKSGTTRNIVHASIINW